MAAPSPSEAGVSHSNETASQTPSLTMKRDASQQDQIQSKAPLDDLAPSSIENTMYTVRKRNFLIL